ncbi:glutamine amidotransferase [Shewanella sp. Scap07]|uniref:glutamine amidotransferase-related protein n=1 Tax=Shewanella sp. Scap07 TaxID=2589987 RepID=UPI0015BB5CD7|nr:glutamine amidotransferase [Shewanella sp. Scap07]QLE86514.1 glutamine amidotransferase [Shewanella sp. Scap07]
MLKIGILLCGDIPLEMQPACGDYGRCIAKQLHINPQACQLSSWRVFEDQFPNSPDSCDVYIVSGSPASVHDPSAWIQTLSDFIQQAVLQQRRLIGICFGHQIIHHALGGHVAKSAQGWGLGVYDTRVLTDFLSLKQGQVLRLIAMHQDQVIIPAPRFNVVAGSPFCLNFLTCLNKQVLTVQAHPEFTLAFFEQFLGLRQHLYGESTSRKAQASLSKTNHSEAFNQMLYEFIFSE